MKKGIVGGFVGLGALILSLAVPARAQEMQTIKLDPPDLKRGLPVMEALSLRASVREWSDREVTLRDLSDLLWAANGINRPDSKKRTAASAVNAQDVDIYVFRKEGVYLYDAAAHALVPVASGDHRDEIMMTPAGPGAKPGAPTAPPSAKPQAPVPGGKPAAKPGTPAPVQLVLVSDASRFTMGSAETKHEWGAIDVGLVSQNIALFCAGAGMATRPRALISQENLRSTLKLKDAQHPFLNQPVGYPK